MLHGQHLLFYVTFLRFKRIFSYVILLSFFKGNIITQDIWTKFFNVRKVLFLCFQKESWPSSHWDAQVTLTGSLHLSATGSRGPPDRAYVVYSCSHMHIHIQSWIALGLHLSAFSLDWNHRLGKVSKRENLSYSTYSYIPRTWPWGKMVFVKMNESINEWGQGVENTTRCFMQTP